MAVGQLLTYSSKEAVSAGVSGGHRRHLRRLDALQEHPVLRRRREPAAVGGEDVSAAASALQETVAVAEWRRRACVLLLPPELLLERRRSVLAPVELLLVVVEGHDGRGRREGVVGGEVDERCPTGPDPERAGGGRGDARELLHHGAEVGGVRVEQRHGRAPRRAGPPPRRRRRLPDPGPLHPVQLLLVLDPRRLCGAPAAAAGPSRRRARHRGGRSGGADPDAEDIRRGVVVGQDGRAGGVVVVVVERGPLREARARVTHRHRRAMVGAEQPIVSAARRRRVCVCVCRKRSWTRPRWSAIYSDPARGPSRRCHPSDRRAPRVNARDSPTCRAGWT